VAEDQTTHCYVSEVLRLPRSLHESRVGVIGKIQEYVANLVCQRMSQNVGHSGDLLLLDQSRCNVPENVNRGSIMVDVTARSDPQCLHPQSHASCHFRGQNVDLEVAETGQV